MTSTSTLIQDFQRGATAKSSTKVCTLLAVLLAVMVLVMLGGPGLRFGTLPPNRGTGDHSPLSGNIYAGLAVQAGIYPICLMICCIFLPC